LAISPSIKQLHDAISAAAVPAGFRKKGSSWYCHEPQAILVIDPQKSQYGAQYFLNLGIYWRALGAETSPREERCHMRGRISSIVPAAKCDELTHSLDFENAMSNEARHMILNDVLSQFAIPLLKRCSTTEGLRAEHKRSGLTGFLLTNDLAAIVGPNLP
jgi:Domain of unknown function (DUF4304)